MFANHRKIKIVLAVIMFILLLTAGALTYYLNFYKEDLNKNLPMTHTVEANNNKPEDLAYYYWMTLMQPYQGEQVSPWKRMTDIGFNQFQQLAGDKDEFAVAVTFWVKLEKGQWSTHNNWGKVQKDGTIKDIQWTFRIKKTGNNEYTLMRIEDTSNAVSGLKPVKDKFQKDAGIKLPNENDRYQIQNEQLEVTYDNGEHWRKVPVTVEDLFKGDYSGPKDVLIEGSYLISPEMTAFVSTPDWKAFENGGDTTIKILKSTNKGKTWDTTSVPSPFPSARLRLLGFTSKQNGYLILSGDRTMSSEANAILKTDDGGKTWVNVGSVLDNYRLVTSGGFINDTLGFISFGTLNVMDEPGRPSLYRTIDGGKTWAEVDIPIPAEYKGIFVVAEIPTFDGTQGTLLVNQGPSGDYQGGKVLARYISIDEGATWNFANLVDPDNVMGE